MILVPCGTVFGVLWVLLEFASGSFGNSSMKYTLMEPTPIQQGSTLFPTEGQRVNSSTLVA